VPFQGELERRIANGQVMGKCREETTNYVFGVLCPKKSDVGTETFLVEEASDLMCD
jgi:hypothetical protein